MPDIGQILGLITFIISAIVTIFVIIRPFLIRFAFRDLFQFNFFALIIILLLVIANNFLYFTLIFHSSYNFAVDQQINSRLGNIDGIIYSRDNNQYYSLSEINQFYSSLSNYFEKYLPVVLEEVDYIHNNNSNNKLILTGVDGNIAQSFESRINSNYINELKNNEIIIPKSFSINMSLQPGDSLKVKFKDQEQAFIVKQIIEDNGIIGFSNPRMSRLQEFKSNFVVSQDFVDGKYQNSRYNSILLKSANISLNAYESQINQELAHIHGDLVFEELKHNYSNKLHGGNAGLNISQLMLATFALPIITILIIVLVLFNFKISGNAKYIAILKTFGLTRRDLIVMVFMEGFIYSLVASILGFIVSIFSANFFKSLLINYFRIENTIITNLNFIYDWNSILVGIASSIIICSLFILLGVLQIPSILANFDLAKNRFVKAEKLFKLKDSNLLLMGLFASVVFAYYLLAGYVENNAIRVFLTFVVIQIFVWLLSYAISKFKNKFAFRILILNCIFTVLVNLSFLELEEFQPILSKYPELIIIPFALSIIAFVLCVICCLSRLKSNIIILSAPFKLIYKNLILSVLTIILIIISIVAIGFVDLFSNRINKSLNDTNFVYDIIATDKFGLANPFEVKEDLLKNPEVKDVYNENYVDVRFADKTYENSGLIEIATTRGIDPKTHIQGVVSTLDFSNINVKVSFQENLNNPQEIFSQNNDYVILGKEFAQTENRIQPKINIGDKIKIKFEKGLIIERIVIGQLEDSSINLSATGLFISINDYLYLRENHKIYFSSLYAINLYPGSNVDDFESKLKAKFANNFDSIMQPAKNIGGTTRFILQIVQLIRFYFNSLILILLLLFIIISYYIVSQNLNFWVIDFSNAIKIALLSQIMFLLITFFGGLMFREYFIQKILKTLNSDFVYISNMYDLVINLILQISLIFLSCVIFIVIYKITNENKKPKKY